MTKFFAKVSFYVLKNIIDFLEPEDYKKMIFLNKNLYNYQFNFIKSYNFNKCKEISQVALTSLLNSSYNLTSLKLGQAKFIRVNYFESVFETYLKKLTKLDLSHTKILSYRLIKIFFN